LESNALCKGTGWTCLQREAAMKLGVSHLAFVLALVLFPFGYCVSLCDEDKNTVLERFEIFRDGDGLLVPVMLGSKKYLFEVDTGASISVFDKSLLPGESAGKEEVHGNDGAKVLNTFAMPDARVGQFRLKDYGDRVFAYDFSKLREVSGYE